MRLTGKGQILPTSFSLCRRRLSAKSSKSFYLTLGLVVVFILTLPLTYSHLSQTTRFRLLPPKADKREVYMTLLCPPEPSSAINDIDFYFEATRILAYRLMHKPSTRDLNGRRHIILATENVSPAQIQILESDGAIVKSVKAMPPPRGTNMSRVNKQWKNQYTKLTIWNMTEYTKVLYIDADILPVRPLSDVFNTPTVIGKNGEPYMFAATYDSAWVRDFGKYSRPVPELGPDDKTSSDAFNAGMFFVHPSHRQAEYIQSIYDNPIEGVDFTIGMEQDLLRYAYRDSGDYPWVRLSQMYNTQWPRLADLEASHAIHDKMWKDDSPVQWDLRWFWYVAWGEMMGWSNARGAS